MSEWINNQSQRKEMLKSVLQQLHAGKSVDEVKAEFGQLASQAGSAEIAEVEQLLMEEGVPAEEIQKLCDVHVAVFREGLDQAQDPQSTPGHPVYTFMAENKIAQRFIEQMDASLAAYRENGAMPNLRTFIYQLEKLLDISRHYSRKENLLFPYLERYGFSGPSRVMWGIHDQIRRDSRALLEQLKSNPRPDAAAVTQLWQPIASAIREMTYKEEKILYPVALEHLSEAEWSQIRQQEEEVGYFVLMPGTEWKPKVQPQAANPTPPPYAYATTEEAAPAAVPLTAGEIPLSTGALSVQQINWMLCNLPVDITYVDENDTVRFFSQTRERIFERTPAIIGRKVQNCHPPQSINRVQKILDDFRAGTRDTADFWISMGGKFILIRYFALRDEDKTYRGTLEVTQDVTSIRALEGERRLLNE